MSNEKIPATLQELTVPISTLVFYAKNARIHDLPKQADQQVSSVIEVHFNVG